MNNVDRQFLCTSLGVKTAQIGEWGARLPSQVYKFSYDRIGRLISRQHPSGHVVAQYEYSKDSELKRVTNARAQTVAVGRVGLMEVGSGMTFAAFSYGGGTGLLDLLVQTNSLVPGKSTYNAYQELMDCLQG